jgi:hypothetical protein
MEEKNFDRMLKIAITEEGWCDNRLAPLTKTADLY